MSASADQWDAQATVKMINESLIERGYVTWFDLTNMKGNASAFLLRLCPFSALQLIGLEMLTGDDAGSTMDAMSDAIEGADVMLYGVSLAYKESANVRIALRIALHGMFSPADVWTDCILRRLV